jgi:ADP-heptose:LPS heptosyltransferase
MHDVAFHFRSLLREDLDTKNYPIVYAHDLINRCIAAGIRVCCIGHPQYSLCPGNCDDLRSGNLSETRMALKSIKVVVGGSSAPMHLASLCGLPIVVWWKAAPFDSELRDRYFDLWNPHKTPVFVVSDSTFQPAPKQVFSEIIKVLDSIVC